MKRAVAVLVLLAAFAAGAQVGPHPEAGIAFDQRVSLTMDDAKALQEARYVKEIEPELSRNLQVKRTNININTSVSGCSATIVPPSAERMVSTTAPTLRKRF